MKICSETLMASIYECAANPELWPKTLANVRDAVDGEYVAVSCAAIGNGAHAASKHWLKCDGQADDSWLDRLNVLSFKMPHGAELFNLPVDVSWTPLTQMSEQEFQKSEFYHEWVKPQSLRDFVSLNYLKRNPANGFLTIPTSAKRPPVTAKNRQLVEQLSPHIRRALRINDLTDQSNLASALCRQVLDRISAAVFVVGHGRRVQFTNAAGEKLLAAGGKISSSGGSLKMSNSAHQPVELDNAIDRALNSHCVSGFTGSAVPLIGNDGDRVAAYVLPLACDNVLGPGHCAVFVTGSGEQQPMALEMLRSMFDLTISEARIAMLIAKGQGPAMIAENLNISVNTVRSHLVRIFSKTDTTDQTALCALVNKLIPPLVEK
jgi:DNA-binding CsgD family transcriptional regulator